jgi:hypothetical protein
MRKSIEDMLSDLGYTNTQIVEFMKYYNYAVERSFKYPLVYAMLKISN